jgi:lincosamide nucleotidyltransferase A/C/D/E
MLDRVEVPDLFDLLDAFEENAVHYWLDGGWGVDCLLGAQSRVHGDVDVVLPQSDVHRVRTMLVARGFKVVRDWLPTSLAARDGQGREVDLHPVDLTSEGGGDQMLPDGATWHYAPPVEGSISGRSILCASAEDQLLMHQGYEPRPIDHLDVRNIAVRFRLQVPHPFDAAE